ncbi:DUF302 domain-containing protein [Gammaproteobacteria bacterium]|nr:DUF302 domain-containing protein [Gammaproteobacteria bacterium]
MKKLVIFTFPLLLLTACSSPQFSANREAELKQTDAVLAQVERSAIAQKIQPLFGIDHSRLAEASGEVLNASRVAFYANPKLNSQVLQQRIRAGLDLPFRVQAYYQDGDLKVRYTDAQYLKIRHGIEDPTVVAALEIEISKLLVDLPEARPVSHDGLKKDYGIIELDSELAFEETVDRLKSVILAEGDTIWFHDIDYQQQARDFGLDLPQSKLLVFGAPAPGASAMREYPSIGLDAFGQKVLVYEQDGKVKVIYNDIPAFAELHYADNALVHKVIKFRLNHTLSSAIDS